MTRFTFDADIEVGGEAFDVRVAYDVTPFVAATYWQPAEGGDVELIAITRDGKPITLPDDVERELHERAEARAKDDLQDEADAEADYRFDQYRDRQMIDRWEYTA
jgi:FKBP-type peptidyl-prolyl cis-trans isomerase (trigger factor)